MNYFASMKNVLKKSTAFSSFMRKGKSGSWREQMSEEMAKEVDRWTAKMLADSSYRHQVVDSENNVICY